MLLADGFSSHKSSDHKDVLLLSLIFFFFFCNTFITKQTVMTCCKGKNKNHSTVRVGNLDFYVLNESRITTRLHPCSVAFWDWTNLITCVSQWTVSGSKSVFEQKQSPVSCHAARFRWFPHLLRFHFWSRTNVRTIFSCAFYWRYLKNRSLFY